MMNRERLEKILPKMEEIRYPETMLTPVQQGYNQAREDCLSALLKAGVGVAPSVEEIRNILIKETSALVVSRGLLRGKYQEGCSVVGIDSAATAIRTLMQGDV